MKTRKILSGIMCAAMLLSGFPVALANEATTDIWNSAYVTDATQALYEDFPMIIDSNISKDMGMTIQLQYLKNFAETDSVVVTLTDVATNTIVAEYNLSEYGSHIIWNDVENNKSFSVHIEENIGGTEKEYTGVISTKNVKADFPADITLGSIEYNNANGAEYDGISIKKVGTKAVCNHNEDEECTEACKSASLIDFIESEDLDTFYSDLDANSVYEMQMDAKVDNVTSFYRGYISTYKGGEDLGIFTRGYTFSVVDEDESISTTSIANLDEGISTLSTDPDDYDFTEAYVYEIYQEEMVTDLALNSNYIIKWTVPESTEYTLETVGNVDTKIYVFTQTNNGIVYTRELTDGGTGGNVSYHFGAVGGLVRYFVWNKESGTTGPSAFRIVRDGYDDDGISAFRSEVKAAYEAGNFSSVTNDQSKIEFDGDINVHAYDVNSGIGYLVFENVQTPLTVDVYTISGTAGPFDRVWNEGSYPISKPVEGRRIFVQPHEFSSEIYYVEIKQTSFAVVIDGMDDRYTYDFDFYDPKHKDAVEGTTGNANGNDNPIYPTIVSDLPYNTYTRTLHKGDTDYYKITTGASGGDFYAMIHETACVDNDATSKVLYNISMYDYADVELFPDENAWTLPSSIGTVTTATNNSYRELTYENLLPNHSYLVTITRPNSTTYSSLDAYELDINITLPEPTATLSGNVALTHTVGNNITDLSAMLNTIMESMTCTLDGVTVDDTTAVADVELYYNNELLTAEIVNSLTAGQYTIVPKYQDVAATGGTVTLTVEAAPTGEIVNLSGLTLESVSNVNWDWAACAKMAANVRLTREGSSVSTKTVGQAIIAIKGSSSINVRGNISETANAANYFYTNGQLDTYNFYESTISTSNAESYLLSELQNGHAVILALTSAANPTAYENARYVLLTGINTGTHTYTIYDPYAGTSEVSESVLFNGGYNSNSDLRFTGIIIEFA